MAQRAHGVGALVSQELVGEARGAMLAAGASFAAKAESCVLCAPRSVDVDELARLLPAPPKELEALQARLLLSRLTYPTVAPPLEDVEPSAS